MTGTYQAVEARQEVAAAHKQWEQAFKRGAKLLSWGAKNVFWHERLEVWGYFGESIRNDGSKRSWNVFGEIPDAFRRNMVVEINPPRSGLDLNLQGVFAKDEAGRTWILHQGRMSVPGKRITQADFLRLTGLTPVEVRFAKGARRDFHPVACIDAHPVRLQQDIARFVRTCALARIQFRAPAGLSAAIEKLPHLLHHLKPEKGGTYQTAPKGPKEARRRHGDVWAALVAEIERRQIACFNTRIKGYGPDLFTLERPFILFEIKTAPNPVDIFAGVGQLHIYEQLLGQPFRKVIVVPEGISQVLAATLQQLNIGRIDYRWADTTVRLDVTALAACVGAKRE